MSFTLKQLRYFDSALRNGSIATAANEMNISKSSITAAIDLIEKSVQADLFRRVPAKGIVPTEIGLAVGERVTAFLEQEKLFRADLQSITGDPTGTLRLGCYAPAAPFVLPPMLAKIAETYPGIRIDLVEGDLDQVTKLVLSGAVDLAMMYEYEKANSLVFEDLFEAPPWALLPENSPLAGKDQVSLADLAPLPMILLDLETTRNYITGLFSDVGLKPNVVHSTKSSSVIRGLVANGMGYSILNICGPVDRGRFNGYHAAAIKDECFAPKLGFMFSPSLQGSLIVRVVREIGQELAEAGAFEPLLLKSPITTVETVSIVAE